MIEKNWGLLATRITIYVPFAAPILGILRCRSTWNEVYIREILATAHVLFLSYPGDVAYTIQTTEGHLDCVGSFTYIVAVGYSG